MLYNFPSMRLDATKTSVVIIADTVATEYSLKLE